MIRILPGSIAYTWGTTSEERSESYPCDRHLAYPDDVVFRGVTIGATHHQAFKWLCQLRVAPYSYDWIDNCGRRSPRKLQPDHSKLDVGQSFMQIFELVAFESDQHITLLITHPKAKQIFGEVALSYVVKSQPSDQTRLIVKLLVRRTTSRGFAWLGPLLPWGDLVMMRKQLLTLKRLSERSAMQQTSQAERS